MLRVPAHLVSMIDPSLDRCIARMSLTLHEFSPRKKYTDEHMEYVLLKIIFLSIYLPEILYFKNTLFEPQYEYYRHNFIHVGTRLMMM